MTFPRLRVWILASLCLVGAAPAFAQTSTFGAGTLYATGHDATGLALADLNHDNHPDLIVAACDLGYIRVRLGDGLGGFGPPNDFEGIFESAVAGVAVADFNGDGHPDIATTASDALFVAILFGDGTGNFSAPAIVVVGVAPQALVAADFNGDGKMDLAVTGLAFDEVTVLLGNGIGHFSEASGSPYTVGGGPFSIRAADLNGDTFVDLVTGNEFDGSITVLLGDGTGAFTESPGSPIPTGGTVYDIHILDLNGDQIPDLVASDDTNQLLLLFAGNDGGSGKGDGTFTPMLPMVPDGLPEGLEVGDFNGDGITDVAVAVIAFDPDTQVDHAEIYQGTGAGLSSPIAVTTTGVVPLLVAAGDVNGDGKVDMAVGNNVSEDSEIVLNVTCCFVTVTRDGTGTGTVTSTSPDSRLNCGTACIRAFDPADSPQLVATAAAGSLFAGWSGACTGTGPCVIPAGADATVTATFDVLALSATPFPAGAVGDAYSQNAATTNGTAPFSFVLQTGILPAGTSLAPNGQLSGTLTQAGTFNFTLGGTDSGGATGSRAYAITVTAGSTATNPAAASATYSNAPQVVGLSATVSNAVAVGAGTVTFTVRDAGNAIVGVPVTSGPVAAGAAAVSYTLPAATPAQPLTITATYNGTVDYLTSSGTSTLTIAAASSVTAAANASTTFSSGSQSVPLSATVTSGSGPVITGTVTFTVRDAGNAIVGLPVTSGTVSGGLALASYTLPAATPVQTLTITAVYSGSTNFSTSTDATHTLAIGAATTTTIGIPAFATASPGPVPVLLTANVFSPGGMVAGGTVTFTVRDAGSAIVGVPVSGVVVGGSVIAGYSLPGGTSAQTLTVTPVYSGASNFSGSTGAGQSLVVFAACTPLVVSPSAAPLGWLGQPFSLTFTSNGGSNTTFALTGAQPPGLTLNGATLTGTPTALGRFDVTVTATSPICSGSASYTVRVNRSPVFVTGGGGSPRIHAYDNRGTLTRSFFADDAAFTGGARVAIGDITGDGIDDIITAPGPGATASTVRVFDGPTSFELFRFEAYATASPGGVYVASGDVNGDGFADIVTGRDGAAAEVKVFDGRTGLVLSDFLAYTPAESGGVRVALGDIDGDGFAEIITAPQSGAPEVRVFSGAGVMRASFTAYAGFAGGVFVAAGDIDGDGRADIVTGPDAGGGPHVRAFSGVDLHELRGFFAYTPLFTGGVRVAVADLDLDGHAEIITAAGPGGGPHVRVWDGATGAEVFGLFAFADTMADGVFVAAAGPQPRMSVDTPAPGATVSTTFAMGGWATEGSVTADSGVDAIDVWAVPVGGGAPIFAGTALPGFPRADVAAIFGGAYAESGFNLLVGPLAPGTYDLIVFVHNTRSATFTNRRVVRVTVTF